MHQRLRAAPLPLLLSLYLLAIVIFVVVTRGGTILAGHPAYPILLAIVAVGALITLVVAALRGRRV